MIDTLLARATTRFVFVVGKGGVGKSTTAAAIALAFADRSEPTHLISTDPAHSIGDLFQQRLMAGATVMSSCSEDLGLEEFVARRYADTLFAELRGPLSELFERGTYLDQADADSFLDLSVPGIDEVMSALRLVDLYDTGVGRVVVDTAPTGHTLRLLDASATVRSWVTAGRAIADKAGVVSRHLVGTRVPLAAESLLDQLEARALRFDENVLREGSAVVVTRRGDVIAAETERLIRDLEQCRLRVAVTVSVLGGGDADFTVDGYEEPRGCDGLREWRKQLRAAAAVHTDHAVHPATPKHTNSNAVAIWLQSLTAKLIFVAGKGGVGKSTCAAAIAVSLGRDRRVCVVSTDPAGSLSEVFAARVGATGVEVAHHVSARQIDAQTELQRMRELYRDSVQEIFESAGLQRSLHLDRAVMNSLWDFAPPGLDELIALVDILEQTDEFDTLVIDSAPTGHFLRLLELPQIALDWVHALLRLLLKYSAVGSLDALARDLLGFAKRLRQLQLDLSTPGTTAVFVVTLDQPVVAAETARLSSALASAALPVAATVLNRADAGTRARFVSKPCIRAPDMRREIVGPTALSAFVEHWEFCGE